MLRSVLVLALDGMDTCCWTSTVADEVAGDRESRKRKKVAVLCCSVMLKSAGTHLVSDPAAHSPRDCPRCCGHYTTDKTTPMLLYWPPIPNERAKQWHIQSVLRIQTGLFNFNSRKYCLNISHHLYTLPLSWFYHVRIYTDPMSHLTAPKLNFSIQTVVTLLLSWFSPPTLSCFHCPASFYSPSLALTFYLPMHSSTPCGCMLPILYYPLVCLYTYTFVTSFNVSH